MTKNENMPFRLERKIKMNKKVISVLLIIVLTLSLLPIGAGAEELTTPSKIKFNDVVSGAWYYSAVEFAVQNGLMDGASDKSFAPDAAVTRAELAAALYRLDGSKKIDKPVTFSDVAASDWYCDAAAWAQVNGITANNSGTFGAEESITRQEMVAMFQHYANYKGRNTDSTVDLSAYTDISAVSDWARGTMGWAVSSGLITGTDRLTLMAGNFATRAQTAAVLMRYVNASVLEKRTSDYVSQFIKGNFNDFYKDSDDKLRQAITLDNLVTGWVTVTRVTGAPGEFISNIHYKQNGYSIVVSTIAGTLYDIRITISYNSDGKPAGIRTNIAPKNPPEPQSTDKWEEVSVKVGEMGLPGMLTLPKGVKKPPVVLLIQGSGASDMNEALGTTPNRPFEDIAHGLAEQGVATLRYNKRTYQYPAGGGDTIEYEILDDAAAAVKLLSSDSRVDADRIYLLGHSLGGMMTPKITADNPQIKGFIAMAGTLRQLQDIAFDQNKAAIMAMESLTEQQKNDMIAQVKLATDKVKALDDDGTGYIMGLPTNYWKSLNAIDSIAIVKGLNVPMLILHGDADFQVYTDKDYKLWQTTLEGFSKATFKLYDGLSHLFMTNQLPLNGAPDATVYNAPNHVAPGVISDIAAWVNQQ